VDEREIRVSTRDGEMTTFVVHPGGDRPLPVAILFSDGMGYREQTKRNARRFAADGYYCVAHDPFYRDGEKLSFDWMRVHSEPEYREQLKKHVSRITPDDAVADAEAVLAAVADDPMAAGGPQVCVGYCMGARSALRAAARMPGIVAAAGIHPGALATDAPDSPHLDLADVSAELYYAFAEHDEAATPEVVDRFRQALGDYGVDGVVERLSGVRHGFAMADLPMYDERAAERHFERTLDLWRRSLSQQPVEV
jgi:carboxymethylenebutenolidase